MPPRRETVALAVKHLQRRDKVLHAAVRRVGPCRLKLQRDRFGCLARAIISQQISVAAARSIRGRLLELAGPDGITPQSLLRQSPESLRTAGVSPQKSRYLLDLAEKVHRGEVPLARIGRLDDEQVIESLTRIKGVGRWTAEMFLIFSLGRMDVLPVDDLGVRSAIRRLYGLADLPDKATCHEIGAPWRPYASVASWYLWRSLEPTGA
ncbi:MAG: DNA-3-methyladenine glycosylase [Pirellulaceae bacterium]